MSKAAAFLALHKPGAPFVLANAFDEGSARVCVALGFAAVGTSSAGFAMTLGRADYQVSRAEALDHARRLAVAIDVPVSADFENGFGATADDAARTVREADGVAGGSIEDFSGDGEQPILDERLAAERITAAAEAARAKIGGFVLTARAEGLLHGETNLDNIIRRLNAYAAAGADVLFAPGLRSLDEVRQVAAAVAKPLSVMVSPRFTGVTLDDFAAAGVARVSLGAGLLYAAYAAAHNVASAIRADGRFGALGAGYAQAGAITAAMQG